MIPIVNDKYQYIFFYNPKCACSVVRQLFLDLHRDEFTDEQLAALAQSHEQGLDEWDNLSNIFPYDLDKDYSDYYKFTLVRHPLTRFISAYLNRVVINMTDHDVISAFIQKKYGGGQELTYSFEQFLDYIISTPFNEIGNEHYLPQSRIIFHKSHENKLSSSFDVTENISVMSRLINKFRGRRLKRVDAVCRMESLENDLMASYKHIFRDSLEKLEQARELINKLPMRNATISDQSILSNAVSLSLSELTARKKMPSYASFLTPDVVKQLVKKYKKDFKKFNYTEDELSDLLNFEKKKSEVAGRSIPDDFDWQLYVQKNPDLATAGVTSRAHLINHWIHNGSAEGRQYK